jgi:hypothetical protein
MSEEAYERLVRSDHSRKPNTLSSATMPRSRLRICPRRKPPLRVRDILAGADEFRDHHGRWPHMYDGLIRGTADQTWAAVDQSLRAGTRGLPSDSSLAKFLLARRGRRHWHLPQGLPVA